MQNYDGFLLILDPNFILKNQKMTVENFEICLKSKSNIYFPGEVLEGEVKLSVKERLRINNVNLLIFGDSKVHWLV